MNKRHGKLAQLWLNALLAIIIVGLLGWLTFNFKTEFDWTAGHRNTLTTASQKLLTALPDPIHFYGFVFSSQATQRKAITEDVDRYRHFKKNVKLTFVDPAREPQKVKQFGVTQPGQLVVEYDGRHEALDRVSEPSISEALERLAHASKTKIAFLAGDGERSIKASDRNGFSTFASKLRNKGFTVSSLNLALQPVIPHDLSVLVIADPGSPLLPGEQKVIGKYLARGGNLLWLGDTDHKPALPTVAQTLGIQWLPGFVVFPNYRELGMASPGIYLAAKYPTNPVTGKLEEITVFPLVRALTYGRNKDAAWHSTPMLTTDKSAWTTTQTGNDPIVFDAKKGDVSGPLTIGLALTREVPVPGQPSKTNDKLASNSKTGDDPPAAASTTVAAKPAANDKKTDKNQRVAVVGDADFLSNGYINMLGNQALGSDIVTWLSNRKLALSITIPKAPDRNLYLPGWASWMISAGYVVVLPLILILFGVFRWAVRRRR